MAPRKTQRPTSPGRRSQRGRPVGREPEAVRRRLLDAARERFTQRAFREVSVRELARDAGVNVAMVHYYFGDKAGLYAAMVAECVDPLLDDLEHDPGLDLAGFLSRYIGVLAANPWLPNLVMREVIYGEQPFRETFIERFASRLGAHLQRLLANERDCGHLRADIDIGLAALSLMSMVVFPFIARPLAERLFGLPGDDALADRLAQHTLRMFLHGAGNEATEPRNARSPGP